MHKNFQNKILVIDCQTTGINPKKSHLLQLAWCLYDPLSSKSNEIISKTFKLSPDIVIPQEIIKLLNLNSYTS